MSSDDEPKHISAFLRPLRGGLGRTQQVDPVRDAYVEAELQKLGDFQWYEFFEGHRLARGCLDGALMDPVVWNAAYQRATQRKWRWDQENQAFSKAWTEAQFDHQEWRRRRNQEEAEAAWREDLSASILAGSGAPEVAIEACTALDEQSQGVVAVRGMATQGKTILLLSGGPGTGKTVAAVSAVVARAKREEGSVFVRAASAARMSLFADEDKATFKRMCETGLLVIDDLGVETFHDGWRALLDELIDMRYSNGRATIITTNLPPTADVGQPSIRARYGERIADRIRQSGSITMCGDASRRKRQA